MTCSQTMSGLDGGSSDHLPARRVVVVHARDPGLEPHALGGIPLDHASPVSDRSEPHGAARTVEIDDVRPLAERAQFVGQGRHEVQRGARALGATE